MSETMEIDSEPTDAEFVDIVETAFLTGAAIDRNVLSTLIRIARRGADAEAKLVKAARLCEVEGNKLVEQEYELCSTLSFGTRLKRLAAAIRSLKSLTDT